MKRYSAVKNLVVSLTLLISAFTVQAAIKLDRTRVIYPSGETSVSINVENENKELPFLAQVWVADENHQKITAPLVALPPLQRLEPGGRSVIRVAKTVGADKLPQDRESLFHLNMREVPPKSKKNNVMQLALQIQLKLFYRPEAIILPKAQVWQEKMVFTKNGSGFAIENPTPFYITLSAISREGQQATGSVLAGFKPVMLAPKSTQPMTLTDSLPDSFVVTYIDDYGSHTGLSFSCHGNVCNAIADAKK